MDREEFLAGAKINDARERAADGRPTTGRGAITHPSPCGYPDVIPCICTRVKETGVVEGWNDKTPTGHVRVDPARLKEAREADQRTREGQQVLAMRQWAIQEALARAERVEARGGEPIPMGRILGDAQLIEAYLRGGSTS